MTFDPHQMNLSLHDDHNRVKKKKKKKTHPRTHAYYMHDTYILHGQSRSDDEDTGRFRKYVIFTEFRVNKHWVKSSQELKAFSRWRPPNAGWNTCLAVFQLGTFTGWRCLHGGAWACTLGDVFTQRWSSLIPVATPTRVTDASCW